MIIDQAKQLLPDEEEQKLHQTRDNRREWLQTQPADWPQEVKANAITPLYDFSLDPEIYDEVCDVAESIEYLPFYDVLNVAFWPDLPVMNDVMETFRPLADVIERGVFMRIDPGVTVYPHADPVRGTSVYVPLRPFGHDYAPLEVYWGSEGYGLPTHSQATVWAWNTKAIHAVFNTRNVARYNMQLSLNIPYAEFYERYVSGV